MDAKKADGKEARCYGNRTTRQRENHKQTIPTQKLAIVTATIVYFELIVTMLRIGTWKCAIIVHADDTTVFVLKLRRAMLPRLQVGAVFATNG